VFQKLGGGQNPPPQKNKFVSVIFSRALNFLTLEDETDKLSRNVGAELPLCGLLR